MPADRAGPGRRRLRHRVGAQGAAVARAGRRHHRRRRRSSSAPARCRSRSRTRTSPTAADLKGKKVGNWGFGNEFELFAGMTKAGLNPASDVTLVQQQFDMQALLKGDIDAAQAMIYNEYAQVLEAKNPDDRQALHARRLQRRSTGTTRARRCSRTPSGPTPTSSQRHGLPGPDGQVPEGVASRAGCSAATTPRSAATSSSPRAPSSARATSCGR